jgi:hypothetical protein
MNFIDTAGVYSKWGQGIRGASPISRRRRDGPSGRDARYVCRPDSRGQDSCDRRVQLQRGTALRGPRNQPPPWASEVREPAAAVQSLRPRGIRSRPRTHPPRQQHRCDRVLFIGQWVSHGQIPDGRRSHEERPRSRSEACKFYNDRGFAILAALDEVATEQQSAPAAVALAWLLARPRVTLSPISIARLNQASA